jgi:hypothetical protein
MPFMTAQEFELQYSLKDALCVAGGAEGQLHKSV